VILFLYLTYGLKFEDAETSLTHDKDMDKQNAFTRFSYRKCMEVGCQNVNLNFLKFINLNYFSNYQLVK
jgi:hypothetical protein